MGNVKRVWNNQTSLAVWDLFNNDLPLNILWYVHKDSLQVWGGVGCAQVQ